MAILEGFRVRNYRVLKDVRLGRLWDQGKVPLTPLTAIIGKNGVGKSTLIDAFGFLADAITTSVERACNDNCRGGFERIRSQGVTAPIAFDVFYRETRISQPITYQVAITTDRHDRPYVLHERLRQRRKGQRYGPPYTFLTLTNGGGVAWKGNLEGYQNAALEFEKIEDANLSEPKQTSKYNKIEFKKGDKIDPSEIASYSTSNLDFLDCIENEDLTEAEIIKLDDPYQLGIATFGTLSQHPRIAAFRRFIEGWRINIFNPNAVSDLPFADPQERLNVHGSNLSNVVHFMQGRHPKRFKKILKSISKKIPSIDNIDTEKTIDGRLLLKFSISGFHEPFYATQMSDGTLKVLAYLLILEDPTPPPFLCIEEPENALYHKLLQMLATEFREYATGRKGGSQILITTHQPYFVDVLDPNEVWILEKGEDGFSNARRASEDPLVNNLVEEGLPLGGLWYSDYLDPRL